MANHTEPTRRTPGLDDGPGAELQVVKGSTDRPEPLPAGAWVYRDAEGRPLMATTRHQLKGGKKSFWQWTPVEGGWVKKGLARPRPLYRLDVIANSDGPVSIVEGEKCVDACLAAWPDRQSVTTWPGGCRNWENVDWTTLANREIAILADADKGGRAATQGIAGRLHGLGCEVQVGLPEGESKEDVADWLEADGPEATAARIKALLQPFTPPDPEPEPEPTPEQDAAPGLLYLALPFTPIADAERMLHAHAERMLLAKGRDERGGVLRTVYALDGAGLWHDDGQLLAAWQKELAGSLILSTLAQASSTLPLFKTWSATALKPAGAEQCRQSVAPVVLAYRERDELPPEGLTECETRELNPTAYLGSPGGVVELATGKLLRPAEGRRKLVTYSLPDPFDADATHPDVERLTAHLPPELAIYLWASLGYALYGRPARTFLLIVGGPGAGKTTLANSVTASLGPYAGALPAGALAPDRSGKSAESASPSLGAVMAPRPARVRPRGREDEARPRPLEGAHRRRPAGLASPLQERGRHHADRDNRAERQRSARAARPR